MCGISGVFGYIDNKDAKIIEEIIKLHKTIEVQIQIII